MLKLGINKINHPCSLFFWNPCTPRVNHQRRGRSFDLTTSIVQYVRRSIVSCQFGFDVYQLIADNFVRINCDFGCKCRPLTAIMLSCKKAVLLLLFLTVVVGNAQAWKNREEKFSCLPRDYNELLLAPEFEDSLGKNILSL